jgi:GNAT superfamily N-acetyltransferase
MEFDITPEITDEIIFSMEDQTSRFLYDSVECRCVNAREKARGGDALPDEDDERYYAIPLWDSVSGFRMMDRFVSQLRNPIAREELRSALSSGHGVFRSFKNILREHPEIERLWYLYKEREMRKIVHEWYNGLRDFWGLERIGPEPEETGEIVSQDFAFREAAIGDDPSLASLVAAVRLELAATMNGDLWDAVEELTARVRGADDGSEYRVVAENSEGDIVAMAESMPLPSGSFLSAQLSLIVVYPEFRGLGIGKELLSRTIDHWVSRGYRWLLVANPITPSEFFPVLRRSGFVTNGHASVMDLAAGVCH